MGNRRRATTSMFLGLLSLAAALFSSAMAKTFGGKVTEVRSAEVVVVNYGAGQYVVHIAGIKAPQEGPLAGKAKESVTEMVLGKAIRAGFLGRNENGDMVARVIVGDPGKDVGLELVRIGLAQRQEGPDPQFGYKYGELSKAENEAREAKRGLWAPSPSR
jgi:endonuclease YncB( thermonuclease family)